MGVCLIRAKKSGTIGGRGSEEQIGSERLIAPGRESVLTSVKQHRVLVDMVERREEARALLEALMAAKRSSEQNLAELRRADLVKQVTGRSSMDNAIDSTRRLIDSFDRVLVELKGSLTGEELDVLAGAGTG